MAMQLNRKIEKGVTVMEIDGTIDAHSSYALENDLLSLISGGKPFVVIDFSKVDYITSTGLRSLLVAAKMVYLRKGFMAVSSLSEDVKKVFALVNFDSILNVFADTVSALEAASKALAAFNPAEDEESAWPPAGFAGFKK